MAPAFTNQLASDKFIDTSPTIPQLEITLMRRRFAALPAIFDNRPRNWGARGWRAPDRRISGLGAFPRGYFADIWSLYPKFRRFLHPPGLVGQLPVA
jgi:hypothetical protein